MKAKLPNFENWKHHNLVKFSRAAYFKILALEAENLAIVAKLEKVKGEGCEKGQDQH